LLVGDAACQLKPFSGGGVVYSLIASEICAGACCKALESEKFNKSSLKNFYEKIWKKVLSKGIKTGMFYRAILSKLSDWQMDILFTVLNVCGRKFFESLDMDFLVQSKKTEI
jgi:digeranylgeranylglycerophospholipid reductase